jgi:hypothetical protein
MLHNNGYKPNPEFGGRKEKDGFVCSSTSTRQWYCVAVKKNEEGVHVRDTKDATDTTLHFSHDEWEAFKQGVVKGEF